MNQSSLNNMTIFELWGLIENNPKILQDINLHELIIYKTFNYIYENNTEQAEEIKTLKKEIEDLGDTIENLEEINSDLETDINNQKTDVVKDMKILKYIFNKYTQ